MPRNLGNVRHFVYDGLASYSPDFGSCFILNLPKFKPEHCFKKILHKEKFHFLDPEDEFEGDIFAQAAPVPRWRSTLDQTLLAWVSKVCVVLAHDHSLLCI